MVIYYSIIIFIFGICLGSFYNVVGYRLPKKESLIYPSSHCTKCNHKLGASELVPIFSYLFLGGNCKNCKDKISLFYPIFELMTGMLFTISYWIFGFSMDFIIAITFISILLIVIISDYQTMIIPDEVLLFGIIIIIIEIFIQSGIQNTIIAIGSGFLSFIIMFGIKKLGDFMFKKESMGGGDIKLMFLFGLVLGPIMSIISIFLASFLALPVSIFILKTKKEHIIPFGPFLSISAIIILLFQINFSSILQWIT